MVYLFLRPFRSPIYQLLILCSHALSCWKAPSARCHIQVKQSSQATIPASSPFAGDIIGPSRVFELFSFLTSRGTTGPGCISLLKKFGFFRCFGLSFAPSVPSAPPLCSSTPVAAPIVAAEFLLLILTAASWSSFSCILSLGSKIALSNS